MHEALAFEHLVDLVSSKRCFSMVLGVRFTLRVGACRPSLRVVGCRFVLLEGGGGMRWNVVVGRRAVSLYFLALLSP